MHQVFQRFSEQLAEGNDPVSFQKAMAAATRAFDLPCFAYLRMPRAEQSLAALVSTYPVQWTDHYLRQHFEKLDPVIQQSHVWTEPFEWGLGSDQFVLTNCQKDFFDQASEFGIRCGFTIPIHDGRGPIAAVTFASDARRPDFLHTVNTNRRVLQLMAISLHAHIRRKLWCDGVINGVRLSPREMECLKWAAAGKTAWAIGTILGVSEHTANFHLANAREKLGVDNLRQAIALYAAALTQS